jgi:Transaldolase/Fructose-6-phosphate aldolase
MYVEQLVGAETVNTMPPETLNVAQDHASITGPTIDRDLEDAQQVFTQLEAAGIDYDDVTATLEDDGVRICRLLRATVREHQSQTRPTRRREPLATGVNRVFPGRAPQTRGAAQNRLAV